MSALNLVKMALTRLDKEVAKGNVSYTDVMPTATKERAARKMETMKSYGGEDAYPRNLSHTHEADLIELQKRKVRKHLQGPGKVDQATVGRRRRLNEALRKTQAKIYGVKTGKEGVYGLHPSTMASSEKFFGYEAPGETRIMAGKPSGTVGRVLGQHVGKKPKRRGLKKSFNRLVKMITPRSVDKTLGHAIQRHEIGEAKQFHSGTARPHASHLGPRPIHEENLSVRGDPKARRIITKLRQAGHKDDATVNKIIRRSGGTAGSPIQPGTRRARSVERMMDRHYKRKGLSLKQIQGNIHAAGHGLKTPQFPKGVSKGLRGLDLTHKSKVRDTGLKALKSTMGDPTIRSAIRRTADRASKNLPSALTKLFGRLK